MALERKRGERTTSTAGTIPNLLRLPEAVKERFPEMADWEREFQESWETMHKVIDQKLAEQ